MKKAVDSRKDQSYVLYTMTQEELAGTLFPLGGLTKPEVRAMAAEYGLVTKDKPESQDICFVPDGDYASYLRHSMGVDASSGPIVDMDGNELGRHKGLIRYTVGQRKGLSISFDSPKYVIRKDVEGNRLVVGSREDANCTGVIAGELKLISLEALKAPMIVTAKTRYNQQERPAVIKPLPSGRISVSFAQPHPPSAPGQAVVFYDGDTVVGGGTIEQVF